MSVRVRVQAVCVGPQYVEVDTVCVGRVLLHAWPKSDCDAESRVPTKSGVSVLTVCDAAQAAELASVYGVVGVSVPYLRG